MAIELGIEHCYPAGAELHWKGRRFTDPHEFDLFLRGPVRARVSDEAFEDAFAAELTALASTQMATATLQEILQAPMTLLSWEIGEALAECLLESEHGVIWPWNENRDKKTPKASLPGADLVGFLGNGDKTLFLFGEVKTSSDVSAPPGVMSGRSGLAHQIDDLNSHKQIHGQLMRWLYARCKNTEHEAQFRAASTNYFQSGGNDFEVVGILLRDTQPHLNDLRSRAEKLASAAPMNKVRLDAWYTPRAIKDWVSVLSTETA